MDQPLPESQSPRTSVLEPPVPAATGDRLIWGGLHGSAAALAIAAGALKYPGLTLVATEDMHAAAELEQALQFFMDGSGMPVLGFPDWETLPYDIFSPLPELVSQRLLTLARLPKLDKGILVVPAGTLLQRLPPREFLDATTFVLDVGDRLPLEETRRRLENAGYLCVSQVMAHGEFAVRGSLLDIFPMGQPHPFRIDLFDDEVESIRVFDPETQRSIEKTRRIQVLPAREFPLTEDGIAHFRKAFRNAFEGDPQRSLVYREVSQGRSPGGLEYYLPLFFQHTATLFDYLPPNPMIVHFGDIGIPASAFQNQVASRYEQRRHDIERPLLPPGHLYLTEDELRARVKTCASVRIEKGHHAEPRKGYRKSVEFASHLPPPVALQARAARPAGALQDLIKQSPGRVLFVAESPGRREVLLDNLRDFDILCRAVDGWDAFLSTSEPLCMTVAPLQEGVSLRDPELLVITETQLLGERVSQSRRRSKAGSAADQVVRNLTELHTGAPVVHEDHGVGRYLGLKTLEVGGLATEFLTLEYAKGDKLYVPVSSLHLVSRYTGASPESAPLHRLGGEQWERLKRRAAKQVRDVAAELLAIYAKRAASRGNPFPSPGDEYASFAAAFEFEETPDQQQAIEDVLRDMQAPQPMDRVVCGDVGFGKTEVAMRAAFVACQGNRQVAVLVPTTLLAQQHHQNFSDRFADWPVRVADLSRFGSEKHRKSVIEGLASGGVDIVIGTHKLLQSDIRFKTLGLVIVDEEHRFGVRHKEKLKSLRSEVDLLTLTATPIPRTLNMAMSGLRDLSIIATPPLARHPINTFVHQWNDGLIQEACRREINRGGQIYFLHNEVKTIDATADRLADLLPEARIGVAHGQMRERELERVMRDFYHQRFNLLVCTTIIESGIDVPSANTIVINRADKLGLAQLHQLRGRVGRSHHRAYAYLVTPPTQRMTQDARKRLEAIESLEDLGAGFTLATHDLEIRGAGELLGEGQSGQIQEIGFSLYSDLLDRAVAALKSGKEPQLDRPLDHGTEIDLQLPALLPESYLPDVHTRLVLYKRVASAATREELRELKVEMIDRFGLLPEEAGNLFDITELKLKATPLGVLRIEAGPESGRLVFGDEPAIDTTKLLQLIQSRPDEFKLDGGNKLRFFCSLPDGDVRVDWVEHLLDQLAGTDKERSH
jgi:transcription-repair coupling factor (superfamily II helicase)